ncbi:hypothetical protein R3P38DRAFT_2814080 [Favolaschia claudopus]|uniref:Uncharacterized protein n=1 Tax=Favolaschia claudopus TaxID=2862362 RepID=A0AAV9Z3Z9_9AGAR
MAPHRRQSRHSRGPSYIETWVHRDQIHRHPELVKVAIVIALIVLKGKIIFVRYKSHKIGYTADIRRDTGSRGLAKLDGTPVDGGESKHRQSRGGLRAGHENNVEGVEQATGETLIKGRNETTSTACPLAERVLRCLRSDQDEAAESELL